jgi:hypothetical protein
VPRSSREVLEITNWCSGDPLTLTSCSNHAGMWHWHAFFHKNRAESEEISLEKALSMPMVFKGSFGEGPFLWNAERFQHPVEGFNLSFAHSHVSYRLWVSTCLVSNRWCQWMIWWRLDTWCSWCLSTIRWVLWPGCIFDMKMSCWWAVGWRAQFNWALHPALAPHASSRTRAAKEHLPMASLYWTASGHAL